MDSCPQSKEEWDIAASKKNCSKRAAGLICAASEEFKYHCVINGYRNALVEVCAPKRLILGIFSRFSYNKVAFVSRHKLFITYFHIVNNFNRALYRVQ